MSEFLPKFGSIFGILFYLTNYFKQSIQPIRISQAIAHIRYVFINNLKRNVMLMYLWYVIALEAVRFAANAGLRQSVLSFLILQVKTENTPYIAG